MKALAWYAIVYNIVVIIAIVLAAAEVIDPAPFSWLESIVWAVLSLPVVYLGIRVLKDHS